MTTAEWPWESPRYLGVERIGAGQSGSVFRVHDKVRNRDVALKTLRDLSADNVLDLKREFRLLAPLAHPRLVSLNELVVEPTTTFFTMELLEGPDFLDSLAEVEGPARFERLRGCAADILEGLQFLSRHGLAHCDLKPANVIVTKGHATLLDFGLSRRVTPTDVGDGTFSGTVEYAAGEVLAGQPADIAADLYALGTMIYEAMFGELPFGPNPSKIAQRKWAGEPVAPPTTAATVPGDLLEVALRCLDPSPAARPGPMEALRTLGAAPSSGGGLATFVGRAAELGTLHRAFEDSLDSGSLVCVAGRSGIGKTELVRHFCRELERDRSARIIASVCHPQEYVRFKAVDAVADQLVQHCRDDGGLLGLPSADLEALCRVFPGLERRFTTADAEPRAPQSKVAERRRAELAFGELVTLASHRGPLVVWIDDLQWVDVDSQPMLEQLVRAAAAARLMVVFSYRDTAPELPFLDDHDIPRVELKLTGLRADETQAIIAQFALDPSARAHVESTVEEADGDPYLLEQLAALVGGPSGGWRVEDGLHGVLDARLDELEVAELDLLMTAASAGVPLRAAVLGDAAGHVHRAYDLADALARRRLLQRLPGESDDLFTTFHARVADAAHQRDNESRRRERHFSLARALITADEPSSLIAGQLAAAGRNDDAAEYAADAARSALEGLAFDQALRFFEMALISSRWEDGERARLLRGHGDALAWNGRARSGAAAYLRAAELLDGDAEMTARRSAAELLLGSGTVREGTDVLRTTLDKVGVVLPAAQWRAAVDAVAQRVRLSRLRIEQARAPVVNDDPQRRRRMEVCWTAGFLLSAYDPISSIGLHARHTREAFGLGDAGAMARGRAVELVFLGAQPRAPRKVARLEQIVRQALRSPIPSELRADIEMMLGLHCFYGGRFADAMRQFDSAARDYGQGRIHRWNISYTRAHRCMVLEFLGRYREMQEESASLCEELRRTEDRLGWALAVLGTGYLVPLMQGDSRRAREQLDGVRDAFREKTPAAVLWLWSRACIKVALYKGDHAEAKGSLAWARNNLRSLFRFQNVRVEYARLQAARAFLAGDERAAQRATRLIAREGNTWGPGLVALCRGRHGDVKELRRAATQFAESELYGFAAAARRYAGDEGTDELDAFAEPTKWLRTFAG